MGCNGHTRAVYLMNLACMLMHWSCPVIESSRLVSFVDAWTSCPTDHQLDAYTHVVWAFAHSYTWAEGGNICDADCSIRVESCMASEDLVSQIDRIKTEHRKVLLSFGGAGMNDCWHTCVGKSTKVVSDLLELVSANGFDGIDLNYEGDFSADAADFVVDLTKRLREQLPTAALLTHTPRDVDVRPHRTYYEHVLPVVKNDLDFLMVCILTVVTSSYSN